MKKQLVLIFAFLMSAGAVSAESMIVEQDFASLFNRFRFAQPDKVPWAGSYFAYGDNGIAVGVVDGIGRRDQPEKSASYFYDKIYNGGNAKVHDFEMKNHSCENVEDSLKEGCRSWWGHCNGWAAAAIKEDEPRKAVEWQGQSLEVGHQKALVTELWLTANSSFLGNTNKSKKTGSWIYDVNDSDYQSFWDTTPRQTFLALTNQIGGLKTGVVVDRFTGEEVWNQPLVGYRILPIRSSDLGQQNLNGRAVYFANIRMKIYWANDNVQPGHLSSVFDISKTQDSEYADNIGNDHAQRLLQFKLFFDAPVVIDSTGTKVTSAGRLVGEGLWRDQEFPVNNAQALNQGHPDFIWLPESAYVDLSRGYGNPHIGLNQIRSIAVASTTRIQPPAPPVTPAPQPVPPAPAPPPVTPAPPPAPRPPVPTAPPASQFEIEVERSNVYDGDNALIAERLILRIFQRAGLAVDVNESNIRFSGSRIVFKAFSGDPVSPDLIRKAFEDAEARILRIEALTQ